MGKHKLSKKHKKEKKKHKHRSKKRSSSSSSASSSETEWVEKASSSPPRRDSKTYEDHKTENQGDQHRRDEWMSLSCGFSTTDSNQDRRTAREEAKRQMRDEAKYDPRKCPRELNPYWKNGGDGLPQFKKPSDDDTVTERGKSKSYSGNWRKPSNSSNSNGERPGGNGHKRNSSYSERDCDSKASTSKASTDFESSDSNQSKEKMHVPEKHNLSDKELNILGAKLVKAEIMGNVELAKQLKEQLESAKLNRTTSAEENEVLLTRMDTKGNFKPISIEETVGGPSGRKKKKMETHKDGKRNTYFHDDDKYSLKQMFENEKYSTAENMDKMFLKMNQKVKTEDDMDDEFLDRIRLKESGEKEERKQLSKSIAEAEKVSQSLDNCSRCIQSATSLKHLMISMGESIYLSLPPHEPLTEGHCLLIPIRHSPCSTQLDENEWENIKDFRKALVKMFASQNENVIFFETSASPHRFPHMYIECVPVPSEEGSSAPIYFKKAIDESEYEWSQNKKLVSLKGRDVRRAIPKGLPYFWVSFGMEEGFAHVIEDQRMFPSNFAQEIIGGMLDIHHSKWKRPKQQKFDEQRARVLNFSKMWSNFDCTKS